MGYIFSLEDIKMDPQKVEAICFWAVPRFPPTQGYELWHFLGFVNFTKG